jgi:hypothetical protein
MTPREVEWWLCGFCFHVAPSGEWGGTSTTAVCPGCGETHRDDDTGVVYAEWTELDAQRKRRELIAAE